MRRVLTVVLLAFGCFSVAAAAHSQSLAEVAKKEKVRRAKNAEQTKAKEVLVLDDHALRNAEASTFSAVQVSGAPTREPVARARLARPLTENPNRKQPATPPKKEANTESGGVPTSPMGAAQSELGRGWSTGKDNTTQMREAPPGTEPMHPRMPGRDKNGVLIYN